MSSPHTKAQQNSHQPQDTIVDADPDPITERAAQLIRKAAENAAFARAQGRFAEKTHTHAQFLADEGQVEESDVYMSEATKLILDAEHNMDLALEEDEEVKLLLDGKRHELSRALTVMPDQSLFTLRDAVSSVRSYVEHLSEMQVFELSHSSHQSQAAINYQRDLVVATGQHIEITLISIEQVRRDPYTLAKQLVTFTTIALEFAHYLPKLHDLMIELGRLLLQFHP